MLTAALHQRRERPCGCALVARAALGTTSSAPRPLCTGSPSVNWQRDAAGSPGLRPAVAVGVLENLESHGGGDGNAAMDADQERRKHTPAAGFGGWMSR